ncbi:hypothetical protein [Herbidospora yilanensis]|uniref:hypothetical protein n=1 Tax=Herbidospora yilanensis TaxID=354426 RepID=UPI0007818183|nr:hypothetical protein [Herbidospora yilanensis]
MAALPPPFAAALLAVPLSSPANRTILPTVALFPVSGPLSGDGAFGPVRLRPDDIALFAVPFGDGMRVLGTSVRPLQYATVFDGQSIGSARRKRCVR